MERYEHELRDITGRQCRHCMTWDDEGQWTTECPTRLRLALDAAIAERLAALKAFDAAIARALAAEAERDEQFDRAQEADAEVALLRMERDAALAERDALREHVSRLEGEKIVVVGKWATAEAARRESFTNLAAVRAAEARAERARREAIEECIAAVRHSYDEPVGVGLVIDALHALLAPEGQR